MRFFDAINTVDEELDDANAGESCFMVDVGTAVGGGGGGGGRGGD